MERCTKTAESLGGHGFQIALVAASIEWKDAQRDGASLHWKERYTKIAESLTGRGFWIALVAASIEWKATQTVGVFIHCMKRCTKTASIRLDAPPQPAA